MTEDLLLGNEHKKLPTLGVTWDTMTQTVGLQFEPHEFRTWDFVLAVLHMAQQAAEQKKREAQIAAMQHAAQQQALAQHVASRLRGA